MIEQLWSSLAAASPTSSQMRVGEQHPHDIYADFEPPDRFGLIVLTDTPPSRIQELRSMSVSVYKRDDNRWAIRLVLERPELRPVFTALCRDIVEHTRSGVLASSLAAAVVVRIAHWRNLMERGGDGLDDETLRGLIAELTVLQQRILPELSTIKAVRTWTGPSGMPQDFQLPTGARLEVKATSRRSTQVHINGLAQLDAGNDPLTLVVVRLEPTGAAAEGAVSATSLIAALRDQLAVDPTATALFEQQLANVGWHDHPRHEALVVRVSSMEDYEVDHAFPRLTTGSVPPGVLNADYQIALPEWRGAGQRKHA